MKFHIALADASPDTGVMQDELFGVDTTAVVDLDMSGPVMRASACATTADLVGVLRRTG